MESFPRTIGACGRKALLALSVALASLSLCRADVLEGTRLSLDTTKLSGLRLESPPFARRWVRDLPLTNGQPAFVTDFLDWYKSGPPLTPSGYARLAGFSGRPMECLDFKQFRDIGRTLVAYLDHLDAKGDRAGHRRLFSACLDFLHDLDHGFGAPDCLVDHMLLLRVEHLFLEQLLRHLSHIVPGEAECMELRLVLGQEFSTRAPFRRAVLAEKAYHRLMCDAVLRERGSPEDLLVGNTKAWLDTWHDMGLLALDSTRSEREAFEELSAVQCAAAMRGLPPRNHLLEKARARGLGYPAELQAESPQARTLLLNLQAVNLPRLDVAFSRHLQQLARRRGVRIVLAILAYRSTTGSYPADLASVERLMGTRLEPDPFTGKAFVFERGPSGFHLSATVLPSPPVPGTPSEVLRLWPPGAAKN